MSTRKRWAALGLVALCALAHGAHGQLRSRSSQVSFFSEAPIENISAKTEAAVGVIRRETGEVAFTVPIRSFRFAKALMQEHFNENYLESDKYPQATFVGKLTPYTDTPGQHAVNAVGKLTIHGVTREVSLPGRLSVNTQATQMQARFKVRLADYNIPIPRAVIMNIAEVVEVSVQFDY